ncbi:hydroxymethylbilane synthase [Methanoculleus sp. UBA430]|uniref:hydroxymethylbilane synthase n=1 Tax=Methanoculleus sp. UBA430 TaxID=1915511 RepID=UPI0025D525FB|nr:hydroxymethylbilane synthase [Methanoculleus sp. UBA430]
MSLRIGTRGSALALAQTNKVVGMLADRGIEAEIITITTEGDTATNVPLHAIGGQGVFVRALDDAILRGEIDAAVHSMKDIPAERPAGLVCAAVLERDSPADFLAHECPLDAVRIIGSSSTRRRAQLLRDAPALEVKQLRGNVDTRLRKLREGQYDAIVLAEAGLQRLGIRLAGEPLPTDRFVPSPNQGTVAVVCRDDPAVVEALAALDHAPTRLDVEIERAVMEEVGGGCFTPQGIFCRNGNLIAEVLALDGSRWERTERRISTVGEARECGQALRRQAGGLIREAYAALGITP